MRLGFGLHSVVSGRLAGLALLAALAGTAVQAQGLVTLQGIKSATVAPSGLGFASLGLSFPRDADGGFSSPPSSSLVLGFGLGNARDTVGVQVSANLTSITESFGDAGSLSVKLSRQVARGEVPVFAALSFDRLAAWGDGTLPDPSTTFAVTAFPVATLGGQDYRLMVTAGYGTHIEDLRREPGGYLGVGIGLSDNLGLSLAWSGEHLTVGSAFRFDGLDNLRFTASVEDVLNQGNGQRLTLSATYYFKDLFGG